MFPRGPACPVCGAEALGPPAAPCPSCGLPAAGQAGWVIGRISATLDELARDRDELLVSLRAAAPGRPWPAPPPPAVAPPPPPPPPPSPPLWPAAPEQPPAPPRRRLSPQQVLLGLGALLLVAGALAFVALAWTRLGLAFQTAVLLTVTAAACGGSAWTARPGLRATEEALAAAGAALFAVDLGAAWAKGLLGVDALPLRLWAALASAVVVLVAVLLGRLTRSTATWPVAALLAAQPVPVLLLPPAAVPGPAGVAAVLAVAALDVAAAVRLRPALVRVGAVLALLATVTGALAGVAVAASAVPPESWAASGLLALGSSAALLLG